MAQIVLPGLVDRRLDDWYRQVNGIYLDRNFHRDSHQIFAHLVEVMGGLSLLASEKTKPDTSPELYVPKALAWWMALCGKLGVRSVEDLLWQKFPSVCPYCERGPHDDNTCTERKLAGDGPDWENLRNIGSQTSRPADLAAWQQMFAKVYPVNQNENYAMIFARFGEELGELAEAIRVFPIAPGYVLSEAADVFAWLMHLQNLIEYRAQVPFADRGKQLAESFASSYPDECASCRNAVCTCPPILAGTLGRIAHEVSTESSSFSEGGALLSVDEAMRLFALGARAVRVGSEDIEVSPLVLREVHQLVVQLTNLALDEKAELGVNAATLIEVSRQVDNLAATQRMTQESMDELLDLVNGLPQSTQNQLRDRLESLGTSATAGALIEAIKATLG